MFHLWTLIHSHLIHDSHIIIINQIILLLLHVLIFWLGAVISLASHSAESVFKTKSFMILRGESELNFSITSNKQQQPLQTGQWRLP